MLPSVQTKPFVRLGTVLAGAAPFKDQNVNDTYRGQVLSDDGSTQAAIIKDLDSRQLASELMVAALAQAIGLPVPQSYLAIASPTALAAKKGPAQADGSRLVFASADARTPPIAQLYVGTAPLAVRQRLAEWDRVGHLYAFDAWVANVDRHERNLLFSGDQEVWIIDHGHCFGGPRWAAADLDPPREYRHRLREWLTPTISRERRVALSTIAASIEPQISALDPAEIGDLNNVVELLGDSDFAALVTFLKGRCAFVPKLAATALDNPIMA